MSIFRPPVTSNQKDSDWERIENFGEPMGNPQHRDHSVAASGKIKFR